MTGTIWALWLASGVFVLTHMIPPMEPIRSALVGRFGRGGYLRLYNIASIVTLAWMVWAYIDAPSVALWSPPPWAETAAIAVNAFAFVLMAGGYMSYNPTAFLSNLKGRRYDGHRALGAIYKITRHPVMWAAILLSATHMLASDTVAPMIFFGTFFLVALVGAWHIDRRKAEEWGETWETLESQTSFFPFAALSTGKASLRPPDMELKPVIVGLALFALFFYGHGYLFGASLVP